MRPFGPVPGTTASSTPNSRASMRTAGPACTLAPSRLGAPTGGAAGASGAAACGAGAAAAGAGAGAAAGAAAGCSAAAGAAAPATLSLRIRSPVPTSSPTLTVTLSTTPAAGEGISMLALSDSRVISDWSASTVSPACTITSMTLALPAEPMSGTWISCTLAAAAEAGAAACGAGAAAGSSVLAAGASAAAAPPSTSSSRISSPSFRVSPSLTLMLFTTPALGLGISMLALSDSRVSRLWSASTASPTLTSSSMTSPSPLPMSGTRINSLIVPLLSSPAGCVFQDRCRA
ncbi:hypothetical protein FQZ97_629460 [compost metagenome]